MTTERMLAVFLNQQLTSPLRVEIVRANTTRDTGQIDLGRLAAFVVARLTEIEALPVDELPQELVYEHGGFRLVLRVRARTADETGGRDVVVEPTR